MTLTRSVVVILTALTTFSLSAEARAQCVPKPGNHQRWSVKTRKTPTGGVHATTVTVADMLAVDVPHRKDLPTAAISGSEEERVYSLYAYVILAKCSSDDGDIHLEVADTPSVSAPRVIVEIPRRLLAEQQHAAQILGMNKIGTSPKPFNAANAVKMHFMGYGFFDLSHASATLKKAGNGSHGSAHVKTIFELHPVFGVGRAGQ